MFNYIIRRLLLMFPTIIGVITITFVISEYVPGGPIDQIESMLEGKGQMGGEVIVSNDPKSLKKKIDPKQRERMIRLYGMNKSAFARYLRTLIWFDRDSVISSAEIDSDTYERFQSGGRNCIVIRRKDQYHAYVNHLLVNGKPEMLVYDADDDLVKSSLSSQTFSRSTGQGLNSTLSLTSVPLETVVEEGRTEVYLKETFWQALSNWDNWHGFFLLKFGKSILRNENVIVLVGERLPVSVSLGVISFFITYTVCVLLGIAKAVKNGTKFDSLTSAVILVGYSTPGFVLGVLLIVLFGPSGVLGHYIPLTGLTSSDIPGYADWTMWQKLVDYLHHLVAPVACFCIGGFAVLTILTKNSVLEQFNQLYATAARARGLSERKVLFKHVFRNSMIPLVTGFPASFLGMFFTGSLLIEKIFSLNGLGLLGYESVIERDFPIVMGSLFVFTLMGLLTKLLTDILYVVVDPRISFEGQG